MAALVDRPSGDRRRRLLRLEPWTGAAHDDGLPSRGAAGVRLLQPADQHAPQDVR